MVREESAPAETGDWPFTDPCPFLKVGVGACGIAFAVYTLPIWACQLTGLDLGRFALAGSAWVFLRVLLLVVGLLAAGAAVVTTPKSPAVLSLAALAALFAAWGMDSEWDTLRLLVALMVAVALFATFLLLLPFLTGKLFTAWEFMFSGHRSPDLAAAETRGRFAGSALSRLIVVAAVLLHFVGIASAIMSVPPRDREPSWVFRELFTIYQPYLQFFYLNNAYRFYSPDPGPPHLLWFHIEYADGSTRWLKLPTRAEHDIDPLGQEFTRRLSIGESVNQMSLMMQAPELRRQKRIHAGTLAGIPLHPPPLGIEQQYAPPTEGARRLLGEYARHVAQNTPSEADPAQEVTGVKVYRVVHGMLSPPEMAEEGASRQEPADIWTYLPFFQGEYDKDGNLKDPDDPFLFWVIPIFRSARGVPVGSAPGMAPVPIDADYTVENYLEKHARLGLKAENK